MRRGMHPSIIMKNDQFIGFNLSYDHCYEHEHGIDGLISLFEIKIEEDDRSTGHITEVPEKYLILTESKETSKEYVMLMAMRYSDKKEIEVDDWFLRNNEFYNNSLHTKGFSTSWDKESFGILVKKEYREYLDELYSAFCAKDVSFTIGDDVCDEDGLKIYITSKFK